MSGQYPVELTADLDETWGDDYPEGWYVLSTDGEPILDRDEGGTLWLVVEFGDFVTARFSADGSSAVTNHISVKICDAAVDADTGARTVKQYVSSALVIGNAEDRDTITSADEKSI
jgi:hypothetical protein